MLSFTDIVRDVLPPTRSYHLREIIWIPADDRARGDDGLGRLTLKLQHRLGVHRAFDLDSYVLDRDTPEPGDNGGAAFWLYNVIDREKEVYRCVVGGMTPKCNCKAGLCKVKDEKGELVCKHHSAIRFLIENGFLNT